jgi:membrane-bound lytic murein transglycosylase D
MMHYHQDHSIFAETPYFPVVADTVQVTGYFNLHTFSKLSGITLDEVYQLNPQLVNTELPAYVKNFALNVPNHRFDFLTENRQMIWDSASKLPFMGETLLANADGDSTQNAAQIKTVGALVAADDDADDPEAIISRKPKKMYHTVRRGETLGRIASRYGVEMYDLKRWNHLRNNKVLKGKRLVIFKEQAKTGKKPATMLAKAQPKYKLRYHRVQAGDTLSTIAERYGIGVTRLKKLNRLRTNTVRRGQKLIVG